MTTRTRSSRRTPTTATVTIQFGDFANAGALNLVTKDEFPQSFVLAEGGSFDTQRYVIGASPQVAGAKTFGFYGGVKLYFW